MLKIGNTGSEEEKSFYFLVRIKQVLKKQMED